MKARIEQNSGSESSDLADGVACTSYCSPPWRDGTLSGAVFFQFREDPVPHGDPKKLMKTGGKRAEFHAASHH